MMRRAEWLRAGIAAFALAGLAACTPTVTAADAAPTPVATRAFAQTEALLKAYVDSGKAPGIVAVIGRESGPPVVLAYGRAGIEADARAVDADTIWRVYSMTKPVTGIAAMMLVEDGKIALDQPVSDFIPAFASMKIAVDPDKSLETRPATRPITVRQLLTHSGGLGYSIIAQGPLKAEYQRLGVLPLTIDRKTEATMSPLRPKSLAGFADRAAQLPLVAEPGTVWSYSMGLDVLARVIEVASGMSYERFLQTRLFGPLGMKDTSFTVPAAKLGRFVTNYTFAGDTLVPLDPASASAFSTPPDFPFGGAGLVMSARDYDRFLAMIQNGGTLAGRRVMKRETVDLALSNLLPPGVSFGGIGGGTGGSRTAGGYGAGGSVSLSDVPGGPKAGTWGWGGAAGTIAMLDRKSGVRATVMVNYFPADKWPLRTDFTRAFYADLAQ